MLVQAPLLAALCTVFFRDARRSFAEHLVLAAYASGFRALFVALVETPLLAATATDAANPWLVSGFLGLWCAYFAFAASQFYEGSRTRSFVKAVVTAVLSQVISIALIMGVLFIGTRLGGT